MSKLAAEGDIRKMAGLSGVARDSADLRAELTADSSESASSKRGSSLYLSARA